MDLSSFLKENLSSIITEGIRSRDIEKAIKLISSYLNKRKIYTVPTIQSIQVQGKNKLAVYVFNEKGEGGLFIWDLAVSAQVETVMFTTNFTEAYATTVNPDDASFKWDVYVEAKGANTVQMCKLVEKVLTGKVAMSAAAIRAEIKDAQLFESIEDEELMELVESLNRPEENSLAACMVSEDADPIIADLKRKRDNLYQRIRNAKKKGQNDKAESLQQQYDDLVAQLADARLSIGQNVVVTAAPNKEVEQYQDFFEEEERATPEERFQDMRYYINNVIAGVRPLALLCGAPGVGKTFRVKQNIKSAGKEQNVDWKLLKGACTATALFKTLHDFKNPGQLVVFDDCDSIFKDMDAINLLKAAYDSDDERWVSWNTAASIPMPVELAEECDDAVWNEVKNRWEYPKEFLYEGGGIIITNFRAGQIDTAVRNRALICDLDFTTDEIIELIRGLAPKIMPDVLTPMAKEQALDYLQELANKNAPVELSIRSFTLCAGIFGSDAPDRVKKRQIMEQMRNQSARGGKRY